MNYQNFLKDCVESVSRIVGKEAKVQLHKVTKNNGVVLDGIIIMEPGRKYSPTVYVNRFYEDYRNGRDIDDIAEQVFMIYISNRNSIVLPEDFFVDYDKLKDNIAYKLINYSKNAELLQQIPHRRWKNLAIVYYVVCEDIDRERAVVLIHNQHMDMWKVDEEELFERAVQNTPRHYPALVSPMSEIISEIYQNVEYDRERIDKLIEEMETQEELLPMYILTNTFKNNGAICMFYDNIIGELADKLKTDVYVIPSSIHEVILIPAREDVSIEEVEELVRYVNAKEVAEEEILSDTVYRYNRGIGWQ